MANVIERLTGRALRSVHSPDYPAADYIHNPPNWSDIIGWPRRYRLMTGDVVSLMGQLEQDAVDVQQAAVEDAAERTEQKDRMDTELLLKALAIYFAKELNKIDAGTFTTLTAQIVKDGIKTEVDNL